MVVNAVDRELDISVGEEADEKGWGPGKREGEKGEGEVQVGG